ncbi:protein SMG7-like [Leptopilina heterotoma]|uniref:protein SMG7-like n=1 Tax=Leptopilina heterotoma TaxID=63436 RepID=UPI001CA96946|nr:protein SMG7-like [Leptopilina heterotoma]
MGLKAAVQALKKAEPLKDKVQQCKDLLNDNDAWLCQQQLQKIYQQVLILDLEYALDRKVEQELWNLGFKNYIALLQSQAKDRKNPKRGESQAMLSWCLEGASGFYLTLLQEICTAFDLDLPFRRKGYVYGCTSPWKAIEKLTAPHKSSCFYACQYCLVHLGDIARYKNQNKQAELFYRHAVSLSPSSGQPYNQLALLEASRGDKLGTVFHYARSIAVKHPFPVATTNLAKTLSSVMNDTSFNINGKTKLTSQEYLLVFLKLHAILHNLGDLSEATKYTKLLTETLTALIATESFNSWRLVQMLVINLYALQHAIGTSSDNTDFLSVDQLSVDEKFAKECILDLVAGSLSALLLPVYTIKNAIVDYFALPSIKLCLDWIRLKPTLLEEPAFTTRLQIWPSLCVLLNGLQTCVLDFKHEQYTKVPLPEDRDLQGFLPLEKSFEPLRFTNTDLEGDNVSLNKLRAIRILQSGRKISQYQINGSALITVGDEENEKFTSAIEGVGPSNELMRELEELSLNKEKQIVANSPVPSESASSKGSSETDAFEILLEKRVGILKPQGSLERNRDNVVNSTSVIIAESHATPATRKPRQNVAMQAIMRRAETEQKQVTFKNISPVITDLDELKKKKQTTITSPGTKNSPSASQPITVQNRPALISNPNQAKKSPNPITSPPQNSISHQQTLVPSQIQTLAPNQIQTLAPSQIQTLNQIQSQQTLNQIQSQQMKTQGQIQSMIPTQGQQNHQQPQLIPQQGQQFSPSDQRNISQYQLPVNCFQNQSFNVQNPAFSKNFIVNQSDFPLQGAQYQQNRLHPRATQNPIINLNPQQKIPNLAQQNISTLNPNVNLQANSTMRIHQQNMLPDPRNNGINLPNTLNMPGSMIAATNLTGYQKNLQPGIVAPPTPLNSEHGNLQMNFNSNYGQQSNFNQMSSNFAAKNQGQFSQMPPQTTGLNKGQAINNYAMFHGYENKDFNPWKQEPQAPPQPPITWWGNSGQGQMLPGKESTSNEVFSNWTNAPNSGNMIGRVPINSGNNYSQNSFHGRHYNPRSGPEDARSFEMDQKQQQTITTGNTYSLFSGNSWGASGQSSGMSNQDQMKSRLNQQSLWSGPGPSPLERLLEQQKSLREGGT